MDSNTPQRSQSRNDTHPQTATRENVKKWEGIFVSQTPQKEQELLDDTIANIHALVGHGQLPQEARYAIVVLLGRSVRNACERAGIDPGIFQDVDEQNEQPDSTPSRQPNPHRSLFSIQTRQPTPIDIEDEEDEDYEDGAENLQTSQLANSGMIMSLRSRQSHTAGRSPSPPRDVEMFDPDNPASNPIPAVTQALITAGIVSGTGVDGQPPLVVGARAMVEAPDLVIANWTIEEGGANLDQLANEIYDDILASTFTGLVNRNTVRQRVHPWLITVFLSFMLGNVFGRPGLSRLNDILKAANKPAPDPNSVSEVDVRQAELKSHDPTLQSVEKKFWATFARVLRNETKKTNAYREFLELWQGLSFMRAYQDLKAEVDEYPSSVLSAKIQGVRPSGRGVGDTSKVIDYVATCMEHEREWVYSRIRKHEAVVRLAETFTSGILVLLDRKSLDIKLTSQSLTAYNHMASILNEQVPALRQACEILEDRVVKPLINTAGVDFKRLANSVVPVGTRGGSFIQRISILPEPTDDYGEDMAPF